MTSDVLAGLNDFRWKDVSFPTTSFRTSLRHDLAQHKFVDVDGARVEATGRAPLQFQAHIQFRNGTLPGKGEAWAGKTLYPDVFRAFMHVCSQRAKGTLQHPELGTIQCYVESCDTSWDAQRRDGADVDVTWVETIESVLDTFNYSESSPVKDAKGAAADLDDQIAHSPFPFPAQPEFEPSFGDMMRSLQAIPDAAFIGAQRLTGRLNSITYRLDALSDALDRRKNAFDWPMRDALERLRDAHIRLGEHVVEVKRPIAGYVTPLEMTLTDVALETGAPVGELILLNPRLASMPTVQPKVEVRYYDTQ